MPKLYVKYKNSNGVDRQELVPSLIEEPTKENISSAIKERIVSFSKKNIKIRFENFFFMLNKDESHSNVFNANEILKELVKENNDDIDTDTAISSNSESMRELNETSNGVIIPDKNLDSTDILPEDFVGSESKSEETDTPTSHYQKKYKTLYSHKTKSTNIHKHTKPNVNNSATKPHSCNSHLSNKQDRLDNPECFSNLLNFMTEHPVLTALAALVIVAGVTAALIGFGVIPAGSGYIAFLTSVVGADAPTASKVVAGLGVGLTILTAGAFMLYGARNNKAAKVDLSHTQEQDTVQFV
jgi:hypothetical protein